MTHPALIAWLLLHKLAGSSRTFVNLLDRFGTAEAVFAATRTDLAGVVEGKTSLIDAILEGGKTSDGFDYAGPLTETVQLGNVATRVVDRSTVARGVRTLDPKDTHALQWDAENCRITNHAAAHALLTKTYRAGWQVTPA